jgi:hypothetical protein
MSNRKRTFTNAVAAVIALGTLVPAAASARFDLNPAPAPTSGPNAATQVVRESRGGFDWGDAGIGAAGGVGASLIAIVGGMGLASRRSQRRATLPLCGIWGTAISKS